MLSRRIVEGKIPNRGFRSSGITFVFGNNSVFLWLVLDLDGVFDEGFWGPPSRWCKMFFSDLSKIKKQNKQIPIILDQKYFHICVQKVGKADGK